MVHAVHAVCVMHAAPRLQRALPGVLVVAEGS